MFGYLRFFLAFLVMISHIGVKFYGLNPGVVAVVVFYILAGFVVSHLFYDILPEKNRLFYFYRDRFLRIFPLYIYIASITVLFLLLTSFGNPSFTLKKILYNATIIPLNYYMYIDSTILTNPHWCLIPPAWSLGAELQAYILLSLSFVYKRLRYLFAMGSFVVYIVANLSILNPDYFGYRFVVGVFFIFFTGSCIYKNSMKNISKFEKYFPISLFFAIILMTLIFFINGSFSPTYTKETFLGLLFGIPTVFFISKSKIRLPYNSLLGSLSYGLFLSHFLSIWILEFLGFTSNHSFIYILAIFILSMLFSYVGIIFVEKKTDRIRYINK